MSAYHSRGVYWTPRTKKDYIDLIVKSGHWTDTKSKLLGMEIKQIKGIFHSIRHAQMVKFMKKPNISDNTNTKNEVKNDRTNNDVGRT